MASMYLLNTISKIYIIHKLEVSGAVAACLRLFEHKTHANTIPRKGEGEREREQALRKRKYFNASHSK